MQYNVNCITIIENHGTNSRQGKPKEETKETFYVCMMPQFFSPQHSLLPFRHSQSLKSALPMAFCTSISSGPFPMSTAVPSAHHAGACPRRMTPSSSSSA